MNRYYLFLALLLVSLNLPAQDPHFSQFYANRIYLNPAYAGFDPGTTLLLNYRDQWFGVPDGSSLPLSGGYRTFNANVNLQLPCIMQLDDVNMGVALSFFQDEAGSAPLTTSGVGLSFSHEQPLVHSRTGSRRLKRLDLRIGGQLSYMQKRLESSRLIYSYQLDPVGGLQGDPSAYRLQSAIYSNMNLGVMVRGLLGKRKNAETLFTVGVSVSNFNEPIVSLKDAANLIRLPKRTTLHFGSTHRITRYRGVVAPWYLAPQFRWDRQLGGRLNMQTIGAYAFQKAVYGGLFLQYNFPNMPVTNTGTLGPWFSRNTTVLILHAGFDVRTLMDNGVPMRKRASGLIVGLSYDVNLSGLDATTTTGVLELNVRVNFDSGKTRYCGELGKFELYNGKCPVRF